MSDRVSTSPDGASSTTTSWVDVQRASAAADDPAPDPVATSPKEPTARTAEVLIVDVFSVVLALAGTDRLDLDAIAAAVNEPGPDGSPRAFVAKGPIETVLAGLVEMGRLSVKREANDVLSYAVSEGTRAEIESPAIVRGARAAVVAVVAAEIGYEIEGDLEVLASHSIDGLTSTEIAFALVHANREIGASVAIPSDWLECLTKGIPPDEVSFAEPLTSRVEEHLAKFVTTGMFKIVGELPGDPTMSAEDLAEAEGDGPPKTYVLTTEGRTLFLECGALAVADKTLPATAPKLTVQEEIEKAVAGAREEIAKRERDVELFKRHFEEQNTRADGEAAIRKDYEAWFKSKGIDEPGVVLARKARRGLADRKIVTFEIERNVTTEELHRVIAEEDALDKHLKDFLVECDAIKSGWGAKKKTLEARLEGIRGVIRQRGRHMIVKQAYNEVCDGVLVTRSAEEHDYGAELAREDLRTGTQLEVPGAGSGEANWTSSANKAVDTKAAPSAAAPAKVEAVAKPVDPPPPARWTGPLSRDMKGLAPVLDGFFAAHPEGVLEGNVLAGLTEFCSTEMGDADTAKLIKKMVKAARKDGRIAEGEGGKDGALLWWGKYEDPRKAAAAPVKSMGVDDKPKAPPKKKAAGDKSKAASPGKAAAKAR